MPRKRIFNIQTQFSNKFSNLKNDKMITTMIYISLAGETVEIDKKIYFIEIFVYFVHWLIGIAAADMFCFMKSIFLFFFSISFESHLLKSSFKSF